MCSKVCALPLSFNFNFVVVWMLQQIVFQCAKQQHQSLNSHQSSFKNENSHVDNIALTSFFQFSSIVV
jgi:hypothetical protein